MPLIAKLLIVSLIPLLLACTEISEDAIDSQVETAVAATIRSQENPDPPPVSDGPPQTVIFCPDCQLVDVTGVVDGDTIDTSIGRVRFFGVDTPERAESCFTEATEFTRLLVGDQVLLEDGPRDIDAYNRRLRYVYDLSGNSVDAQLVSGGYAMAWTGDGQHRDKLLKLESSAKLSGAGCLWRSTIDEIEITGDVEAGRAIFIVCGACHSSGYETSVGPGLAGILQRADARTPLDAISYIQQSLREPNAYVVDGFQSVMPSFGISGVAFDDLVAYLNSLE